MTLSQAIFTFINAWCVTMFMVMPFCIRKADEKQALAYEAAPKTIFWRKIVMINTLAALTVTVLLAVILHSGVIELRDVIQ